MSDLAGVGRTVPRTRWDEPEGRRGPTPLLPHVKPGPPGRACDTCIYRGADDLCLLPGRRAAMPRQRACEHHDAEPNGTQDVPF